MRQYHITSIHIGGFNTSKNIKNILPHIKGLRGGFLICRVIKILGVILFGWAQE